MPNAPPRISAPDRGAFQITEDLTMSDKTVKGIDRRELIMASIATVGAAAALAANAGSAKAQGASAPSAGQAPSGTVYTGEVIQGKKVVSKLDVNDLEPGKKHLLY